MPSVSADREVIGIAIGGRSPFLYIGPHESHVTDIIGQSDAYVSSHGDVEGVVENILRAMKNSALDVPGGAPVEELFSKDRLVPQMISAIERTRGGSCAA
jgi:hypothetical protein